MSSLFKTSLIAILAIQVSSCSNNSTDKELISLLKAKSEEATRSINQHTNVILRSLIDKSTDPKTAEKATIWLPKAERVAKESATVSTYIEQIKKRGKITSEETIEITKKLKEFSNHLLSTDEKIKMEFEYNPFLSSCESDSLPLKNKTTRTKYLKSLSKASLVAMLTNIQTDISLIENKIITYCHEQFTYHVPVCEFYSALIGQNTNTVFPGGKIEITAGVGIYSTISNPKIMINEKMIPVGEEGFALCNIKAPAKSGKYKIPVKISYVSQITGKEEWLERDIEYTVTPPCN